jgi:GMP synthase (glutamine-hydrolysing)
VRLPERRQPQGSPGLGARYRGSVSARVLVIQNEAEDPINLMGVWMEGVDLTACHAYDGEPVPASTESFDGLVVMGGAMGAHDDEKAAWLPPTRELIRLAAAEGVPTLGICLGHQLCAVALGGEIEVNPKGRQLGLLDIGWTAEAVDDALVGGLVGPRRALHFNYDIVSRLPEGAVQLATASTGEVQAARHAPTVWGIQWHPEVDDALGSLWLHDSSVSESEREQILGDLSRSRRQLDEDWQPLAARFAASVRAAAVRR